MIVRHRDRGILQLVVVIVMTALLAFMYFQGKRNLRLGSLREEWLVLWFLAYLLTVAMWMMGSFSLARAKGYDPDMVGGMLLFLFVVGFCFPFAFPGFVLFALKDRTRGRNRWN